MSVSTILLACGGTGGHIFPAFSVAEELRRRRPDLRIVFACGTKDIENEIFRLVAGEPTVSIEGAPWRGASSLCRPSFLLKSYAGFSQARAVLKREKPLVVVGFGGHFAAPVILAAKSLGIRSLLHEQNVVPGSANRLLCRLTDGVALSFEETRRYLPRCKDTRVTGNPIRSSIESDRREEAMRFFGFDPSRPVVLVLGGSQGAESINTLFFGAAGSWDAPTRAKVQVVHLCGRLSAPEAEARYRTLGIRARAFQFFDRMDLAYSAADAAVGRAGATFLAEIYDKGIPAVLIPYPFAGGHQLYNAKAFAGQREAVVVEQGQMTPAKLAELVREYIRPGRPRAASARPGEGAGAEARRRLADFILETM